MRTFRLGDFGWSGITFDVPDNVAFYGDRLDLTATKGFFVDVAAGVDIANKEAFWILTTIDPNTGEIPTDPTIGFLPPNNQQGIGDGFVNYTIRPSRSATTATVIDAQATIVFDNEAPIDTPPIFNTLDAGKPTSSVEALANSVNDPEFAVKWSGSDDENGSGIASYDVYVSENGGNFTLWLDDTTLTEATYVGQYGKTYAFYTVAVDNVGNIQTTPTTAQATTRVTSSTTNQPPTLTVNNGLTLDEAATTTINSNLLQVTDTDNTPTQLTYTLTTLPAQGTLKLNNNPLALNVQFTQEAINNNLLTYTHNGTETISDRFNFTLTDGTNALNSNLFGITINPVNDIPTVVSAIASQTINAGQTFVYTFPANTFSDADLNEVLTYSATLANGEPLPTWLTFNGANRTFNGTSTNSAGTLNLVVIATDTAQASVSSPFNLTIIGTTPVEQPPTVNQPLSDLIVNEDAVNTVLDLTNVFADPNGDAIVKSIVTNSNSNLVTVSLENNTLTLDYLPNQFGTAQITVRGTANGQFVDDTFSINVGSVDDAPVVSNPIADVTVNEDASDTVINLATVFSDIDGDAIVKTILTNTNTGLVTVTLVDNQLTLDYLPNQFGTAQITVRGTANGQSVEDTFTLTVNGVNDAPTVNKPIDTQILTTNNAFSFTIPSDTFSDVDTGDTLSYTINNDSTFTLTNRTVTGTPTQTGAKTLTLVATDSQGLTAQTPIQLNIFNPVTGATNGDNTLTGTDGDDLIDARDGRDNVTGGKGNDRIVGGSGADVLGGGEGRDTFVYSSIRDSGDRLTDFDVNQDYLDFSALLDNLNYTGSNPVTDGYVSWRTLGTGTLISVDSDGAVGRGVARPFITLDGVISSALSINNFVF